MLHTNSETLWLLFNTFARVWSSGGQVNLSLYTKDSQVLAKLDLQLGPADGHCPGRPAARGRAAPQPWSIQEHPPRHHLPARRIEESPWIFEMPENDYAETKTLSPS